LQAFAELSDAVRADVFLYPHFRYFLREARARSYAQFLEPYKSVTLAAMAEAFGVGPAFLDAELADFIAAGRLPARVDRVAGLVETDRPDAKSALYQAAVKQGDALLNRVQRLARVADVE
jgi:26S proteasome regulatory subunit N7